jgi:hypothetical protein
MEFPEVSQFGLFILNGMWAIAETVLERLGVEAEGVLLDVVIQHICVDMYHVRMQRF